MNDLISRQAAIDVASGYCHPANIADELRKLPSAQPEPQWIPCSERLPKSGNDVLATDGVDMFVAWYECDEPEELLKGWHSTDYNFDYNTSIVAWMPLPENYRGDKDGNINNKE